MTYPTPNHDENLPGFIGNFHKTLPHDAYGEVMATDYTHFRDLCLAVERGEARDFETVAAGTAPATAPFKPYADTTTARLTSPLAGAASEWHGPEPQSLEMRPAPGILSLGTAAEMVELYWMALLRDMPLAQFGAAAPPADVGTAITDIARAFGTALAGDSSAGALALGEDLPQKGGVLDVSAQTLFRCGLKDEEHGPLVSQFFLRDVAYGAQRIDQTLRPYARRLDFLTDYGDWLRAQNTGKDCHGRDYGSCNHYADNKAYYALKRRHISTLRDLARFVNRDALHQAYFNAALCLLGADAPLDAGNPYGKGPGRYTRQGGFATLGGPDLLTLVSEVASRALAVVWRQKWLVHRRARPEVYGGLIHVQEVGPPGLPVRPYGLPELVLKSEALARVRAGKGSCLLPMAFSAGSPAHPAYGAGHATVGGACVTVLKAWFDEDASLQAVLAGAPGRDPDGDASGIVQPGDYLDPASSKDHDVDAYGPPQAYTGADAGAMTVGGELNKLAANVAMGRSMGGVHWRSDNTRSLRLGEQVAIEILRKRTLSYAERPVSFSFTSFDRRPVRIERGKTS